MKKLRVIISVIFISILTTLLSGCYAKVPMPKIKEGRFDFSVTYEINGEQTTYNGVYVCEEFKSEYTCALADYILRRKLMIKKIYESKEKRN